MSRLYLNETIQLCSYLHAGSARLIELKIDKLVFECWIFDGHMLYANIRVQSRSKVKFHDTYLKSTSVRLQYSN